MYVVALLWSDVGSSGVAILRGEKWQSHAGSRAENETSRTNSISMYSYGSVRAATPKMDWLIDLLN